MAGSGVGGQANIIIFMLKLLTSARSRIIGGVIYPIMFRRLFVTCGFAWGVRISGFIGLALCIAATFMISSRLANSRPKASEPWLDLKHLKDITFMLLVIGSVFVSLGERSSDTFELGS